MAINNNPPYNLWRTSVVILERPLDKSPLIIHMALSPITITQGSQNNNNEGENRSWKTWAPPNCYIHSPPRSCSLPLSSSSLLLFATIRKKVTTLNMTLMRTLMTNWVLKVSRQPCVFNNCSDVEPYLWKLITYLCCVHLKLDNDKSVKNYVHQI